MKKLFLVLHFIRHFITAKGKHSLHSPFIFQFYTKVIQNKSSHPAFEKIELLRKTLKADTTEIDVTDFGAGSKINNNTKRSVASISKSAEKKPALAQLLFRIINHQKPKTIIDLGTSLGITTLYESFANPVAMVYTFEGCPNIAEIARQNFEALSVKNIEIITGNIDITLKDKLSKLETIDFAFFDANHRYQPTINYFHACLEKTNEDSIFIFDDIYWSKEMKQAWEEIKKHSSVGMSIDLFYFGIVFFRKKQPVQHFTLS